MKKIITKSLNQLLILMTLLMFGFLPTQNVKGASVPYPVPHRDWIKLSAIAYQPSMSSTQIDFAAKTYDNFLNPHFLSLLKTKTNAPMTKYEEYRMIYDNSDKYTALVEYAGSNIEDMFIHYASPTTYTFTGTSVQRTAPGGKNAASRVPFGYGGNTNGLMVNPGNANFQAFNTAWEVTTVTTVSGGYTYDGLMVDDTFTGSMNANGVKINSGGDILEYPTASGGSGNFDSDIIQVFKAVHDAFKPLGKIQIPNESMYSWPALNPYIEGILREDFLTTPIDGTGTFSNRMATLQKDEADGVASYLEGSTDKTTRGRLSILANYYLYSSPSTYFDRADSYAGDLQTDQYVPAVEYNVGQPKGAEAEFASGTDPATGYGYDILSREFDNALVFFKLVGWRDTQTGDATATTHTLPTTSDNPSGRYYLLNEDGTLGSTTVAQVTLRNFEGAILIKESALTRPSISKTVDKISASTGDILTYTISYSNPTANTYTNVKIEDPIPSGTTYVDNSATGGATLNNGKIELTIGSLAPNASGSISFQVRVQ